MEIGVEVREGWSARLWVDLRWWSGVHQFEFSTQLSSGQCNTAVYSDYHPQSENVVFAKIGIGMIALSIGIQLN